VRAAIILTGRLNVIYSKFIDGTEVFADFNTHELLVNGKPVERPPEAL